MLRSKLAYELSELSSPRALALLENALPALPYSVQKDIASALAKTKEGVGPLLYAADEAKMPPRLLLEPQIRGSLLAQMTPAQKAEYDRITSGIKAPGEEIQPLIEARLQGFADARPSLEQGGTVFSQYCSPCHRINDQGGNIGPQLDGVGNWGRRALTEKVLDPNRNISRAFVNYTLTLADGKTVTGLFRREEGQTLVFADVTGKEFSLAKSEIAEQKVSPFTLMPDHFGEVIPEEDYYALLNYLLQEK